MPIKSFKAEWALVNKNYEKATGKKKPSAKLAGATKSASGLEPACSDLDTALKKGDGKAALKAATVVETAVTTYQKALAEATKGEDKNIAAELKVMMGEIALTIKEAKEQAGALSDKVETEKAAEIAWTKILKDYVATTLPANAAFKAFISNKAFGLNPLTNEPVPEMAHAQAQAKQQVTNYVKKLSALKSFKFVPGDEKAMKECFNTMMEANDELGLIDGLMQTIGVWRRLAAGSTPQAGTAYNNSPVKGIMDTLNDAGSAENQRLGILQQAFERQVMNTR